MPETLQERQATHFFILPHFSESQCVSKVGPGRKEWALEALLNWGLGPSPPSRLRPISKPVGAHPACLSLLLEHKEDSALIPGESKKEAFAT